MSGPLILLIGPEAEDLAARLEASGYRTALAGELPDPPAAVLISGPEGAATIPALRMALEGVPLLLDIVSDSLEGRSRCLTAGADDFWMSSAGASDLLTRLRLHLLLGRPAEAPSGPLRVADLSVDPSTRVVRRGQRRIELTSREYQLLLALARHPGVVLSREQLLGEAWSDQREAASNVVEVYVRYLRQKLEDEGERRLIHTVRGRGYCLCERMPAPERPPP